MSLEVISLDSVNQPYRRQEESIGSTGNGASRKPPGKIRRFVQFLFSRLCVGLIIAGIVSIVILCVAFLVSYEKDTEVTLTIDVFKQELSPEQTTWYTLNLEDLKYALNVPINTRRARNVIVFVTDGFPPYAVTKARSRLNNFDGRVFSWERFPHMGLLRHEKQFSAPTALFGGVRGHAGTVGVDMAISSSYECNISEIHHVSSILQLAHEASMSTGIVTNTDPRDSTVAALYAHVSNNSSTCPSEIPKDRVCSDIETQLLFGDTATTIDLIMSIQEDEELLQCSRLQTIVGSKFRLFNDGENINVSPKQTHDIRALFPKQPLKNVVSSAIRILERKNKGFLLVVHYKQKEDLLLPDLIEQMMELDDTVRSVTNQLKNSMEDTLLIVTSIPFAVDVDSNDAIDTAIHARGPTAHLFHKVHDPSYVAHVIGFAARLGRFRDSMLASSLFHWF